MKRILVAVAAALAACSPPTQEANEVQPAAPAAPAPISALIIEKPVARPPIEGQTTGVGYLTVRNAGDAADRLLSASSPAASSIELHTHTDVGGMKRMERVDGVDVPAGGAVVFQPGGLHLMMFGFTATEKNIPVKLHFQHAGDVTVFFKVMARSAGEGEAGHASDGGHEH